MGWQIDRVESPTIELFRDEYFRPQRPLVIRGRMENWAARDWTPESIVRVTGNPPVDLLVLKDGYFHIDATVGIRTTSLRLGEYLDRIRDTDRPAYYLRTNVEAAFEPLRRDFEVPEYCLRSLGMKICFWMGARGNTSDIHFDMNHNISAQIRGRRRVALFAPEDSANLYPFPHPVRWHHSQVHLEDYDEVRFPKFRRAKRYDLVMEPGEMLFIPRGWWHRFEALEPSMALSFFWVAPSHALSFLANRALWTLLRQQV
jgi:ribosomal protein L16 Arg81 hydroxylase